MIAVTQTTLKSVQPRVPLRISRRKASGRGAQCGGKAGDAQHRKSVIFLNRSHDKEGCPGQCQEQAHAVTYDAGHLFTERCGLYS